MALEVGKPKIKALRDTDFYPRLLEVTNIETRV